MTRRRFENFYEEVEPIAVDHGFNCGVRNLNEVEEGPIPVEKSKCSPSSLKTIVFFYHVENVWGSGFF